jgi:enediyne biosynthesis protein E4
LRLEGTASNRSAIGAVVTLTAAGRRQTRAVLSQTSYYSHDDLRLHFGIGTAAAAERIDIRWPGGATQRVVDVRAGQTITITEPLPSPR